MEQLTAGLESFPNDVTLLTGLARLHEEVGDAEKSVSIYKQVFRAGYSPILRVF